jgi:hypothetical protein
MSRAMHDRGRMIAVAVLSAGVGAIMGALGVSGYRRNRGSRTGAGTGVNSSVRSGSSGNHVDEITSRDDARLEATRGEVTAMRVEAAKMDESPSAFAAGDEVGGDVIGEIHSDDIANGEFGTSIRTTHLTDAGGKGAKGSKSKGKRANGARARRNVSGHNGRS